MNQPNHQHPTANNQTHPMPASNPGKSSDGTHGGAKVGVVGAVVLARAGSKGLANKNVLMLAGRPMVGWTLEHALKSKTVEKVVLSTDGPAIAQVARQMGMDVVDRPADLAGDLATVDSAARHAVQEMETRAGKKFDVVVILYGNVPLRPADLTDRGVAKLLATGADSVQSVCPVGKMHPYWMKKLDGPDGDILQAYVENTVYRRQDLPGVYMLDGGLIVVKRDSLFTVVPGQPHAFLGKHRRAVITQPGEVVDIDGEMDFLVAKAMMEK